MRSLRCRRGNFSRRAWSRAVALPIAAIMLFVGGFYVGSAWAGNWTTTDNAYKAGDSNVVFDQCALQTNTHNAFHANDSHDIEPTQITTTLYHRGCDTDDVRINDYAYGTSRPTGWYECHAFHSSQNCNRGHAHINTSYSNIPENYNRTLTLVCEEIGHSVGLAHRKSGEPASCMGADLSWLHLSGHDQTVINNHY